MYDTILVTLDGTSTDRAIIEHVKQLARLAHSRVVLLHVADGWAARTYGPDAVSPEISEDTAYLHRVQAEFQKEGIPADAELALRRAFRANRQMGGEQRLRPCRDEHSRTPLPRRHLPRRNRDPRPAPNQRPCPAAPRKVSQIVSCFPAVRSGAASECRIYGAGKRRRLKGLRNVNSVSTDTCNCSAVPSCSIFFSAFFCALAYFFCAFACLRFAFASARACASPFGNGCE